MKTLAIVSTAALLLAATSAQADDNYFSKEDLYSQSHTSLGHIAPASGGTVAPEDTADNYFSNKDLYSQLGQISPAAGELVGLEEDEYLNH